VPFTHDTEAALQAAVVLANSALEPDTLRTVEDLDAFFTGFEYTGRHDLDEVELQGVRAVRPALYELLTADRDTAVAIVNRRHGEWDWHLHAVGPDRDLATRIVVETAMAMIDVIRADEMSRLGICADETCQGVVLDLSRNRSKRFCSTTCGNRSAVAAYRARQSGTGSP
jgi:hypothetical protein